MKDIVLEKKDLGLESLERNYETFIEYLDVDDLTLKTYKVGITSFIGYLKMKGIASPTREDVISFRDMLRTNYSSNTVNTYMVGIKAMFKFLSIKGLYDNITEDVKGARFDTTPKKEVLSVEQIRDIYNSITNLRDKALFSLMVGTGCRVCEVYNANIEDIKEYNGETVLFILGKKRDSKCEYVKLSSQVLADLKAYIGTRTSGSIFISTSPENFGERLSMVSLRKSIKKVMKNVGIDKDTISCHSLRRTFAVVSFDNGADIYSIKEVLHHSSINTTTRYLRQVNRDNNKTEYNVSDLLFGSAM